MCWWDQKSTTTISTGSIASVLGFLPRKLYNALRVKLSGSLEITTSDLVVPRALASHKDRSPAVSLQVLLLYVFLPPWCR